MMSIEKKLAAAILDRYLAGGKSIKNENNPIFLSHGTWMLNQIINKDIDHDISMLWIGWVTCLLTFHRVTDFEKIQAFIDSIVNE